MSRSAIEVEGLGKAYRIGVREKVPNTLMGAVTGVLKNPFRNLQNLRRLNTFADPDEEAEDTHWALKDVSFTVNEGEVVGVIGRNGAGKSTLLKILSRITEPTRGRAVIRGRVSSLLEVGTGFHHELTGRENVYMNGTVLGMTKREIDQKFDEIVAFSGVERQLDTPIKRYSSGQKVRLAFSVAAHLEPEILVIDEVLAVGDAEFQRKCLGKMKDVAGQGRTVLFVSHNMAAVRSLCGRGLLLVDGRLQLDGPAKEAVGRYLVVAEDQDLAGPQDKVVPGDPGRGENCSLVPCSAGRRLVINCGESIKFDFRIECDRPVRSPYCGILLLGPSGEPVLGTSSQVQGVSVGGVERTWRIAADFGVVPLNAGTYGVRIYFGEPGGEVARFSDAFSLQVRPYDVFRWGREVPSAEYWGPFYWTTKWSLSS